MEGQTYQCPGCFTTITAENIDFKTRRATCPACGNLVILTRKVVNSSKSVVHDMENAVSFFCDGNFESAKRYAESALSYAVDNAAALYIIGYYYAFVAETKTRKHLDKFFNEIFFDLDVDDEELDMLKSLMLKTKMHLADYEKSILKKLNVYQSASDLTEFVDAFSPYLILARNSMDWLDEEMVGIYAQISRDTDIPKTWYALLQSIIKNPDSPEASGSYFFEKKVARFYNDYIGGIGKIFGNIKNAELKAKFGGAFLKTQQTIKNKMK